jgi:hypothetical protein
MSVFFQAITPISLAILSEYHSSTTTIDYYEDGHASDHDGRKEKRKESLNKQMPDMATHDSGYTAARKLGSPGPESDSEARGDAKREPVSMLNR